MRTFYRIILIVYFAILNLIPGLSFAGTETAQSFTFQGRLFNAAGTEPLDEPVILKLQILGPSADCLLYEESQTVNLTNQSGVFSISIGGALNAPKRTSFDPGLTMAAVFKNDPLTQTLSVHANCPSGYTSTAGDHRLLRVIITPSSTNTPEVLSPDQIINSVPMAFVAETLQGIGPSDFVKKDPIYVTNSKINILFGSIENGIADASTLHHHDGRYLQTSSTSSQLLGAGGFNTSGKGGIGTSSNFANTTMSVKSDADANIGLAIRANSAIQSADIFQVQNSLGTKLASVSALGGLTGTSSTLSSTNGNQLVLQYDSTNQQTVDVNSTGTTTFTAAGSAPKFSFIGGNVGIGTATPTNNLVIQGNSGTTLAINDTTSGNNGGRVNVNYNSNIGGSFQYVEFEGATRLSAVRGGFPNLQFYTSGSEKLRILSNGNIGIGTSTPTAKLSINSTSTSSGVNTITATSGATTFTTSTSTTLNAGDYIIPTTTTSQARTVTVSATGTTFSVSPAFNSNISSQTFTVHPSSLNVNSGNFFVQGSSGNIGIGTTNPSSRIHAITSLSSATGNETAYNLSYTTNKLTSGSDTGLLISMTDTASPEISLPLDIQVGGSSRFKVDNTGAVTAVAFYTPTATFYSNGNGYFNGSISFSNKSNINNGTISSHVDGTIGFTSGAYTHTSSIDTAIKRNSSGILEINNGTPGSYRDLQLRSINPSTGNVGIGTNSPQTKLQVAGVISPAINNSYTLGDATYRFTEVYATNGTINTSDKREKKEIQDSNLGIIFINKLRPVSYKWNTGVDNDVHYGLIAQEAERVLRAEKKTSIVSYDKKSDRYGVRYSELISPLIKAVQEIYKNYLGIEAHNQVQDRKIALLKDENMKLKEENKSIKAYICSKDPVASLCDE